MRGRAITAAVLAAGLMSGLASACSSSTAGTGGGSATASSPAAPATRSSATAPAPATSEAAASTATVTSAVAPSSAAPLSSSAPPSSAAPTAPPVAAPKACAAGQCTKIQGADLGSGYTATVYSGPSPSGQIGAEYLELSRHGVSVFWKTTDGYNPGQLACSPTPAPNCAVEDAFGAHASSARGFTRVGDTLVQFDEISSDTPDTDVQDLDGDGWIDVVAAQNTYEPSYATGKVYWTTALSNGRKFVVSGCTPKKTRLAHKPTAPVTGPCSS